MPRKDCIDRQLMMYFPSNADRERWRGLAKDAEIPFCKWIYDIVELHLNSGQVSPRAKAAQENAQLKAELQELQIELATKARLLERTEAELYKARHGKFDRLFGDAEEYDERLVDILQRGNVVTGRAILKELGIDPKDAHATRLVGNQLEELRRLKLVEETASGWRWTA